MPKSEPEKKCQCNACSQDPIDERPVFLRRQIERVVPQYFWVNYPGATNTTG